MNDIREELLDKYTTPGESLAFAGRNKLSKLLKRNPEEINENILSHNYAYGLHRETKRPRNFNPYFSKHPRQQIQCDLIDMQQYSDDNDGINYLLVCIDIFSRRVWIRTLKTKHGALTTLAMQDILDELDPIYPNSIQFDYGKEFRNRHFLKLLSAKQMKVINPYTANKAVYVERVNSTLQKLIHNYMTEKGTRRYIDVLPNLLRTYNTRPHRAFDNKFTPLQAELHDNVKEIRNLLQRKREKTILKGRKMKPKFKINDIVRIRKMKKKFERGYEQKFTDELFVITEINHKLPIITYTVKSMNTEEPIEGSFYAEDLQLVRGDMYRVEKILKKKKIKGKEYVFVKWLNFDNRHNSWVPASDVVNTNI